MASKELILTFLGTGAMRSSFRRGTSALELLIPTATGSESWLFDCGEGTFRQFCIFNKNPQKKLVNNQTSSILNSYRLGCNKLNRLFITHLHGDHCFGLSSVILGYSFDSNQKELENKSLSIYGPVGIAEYLSTSFRICNSYLKCNLDIYELCLPNQVCYSLNHSDINYSHIHVHSIYPNDKGIWECVNESFGKVEAGTIAHNQTTFGFSYHENNQAGTIQAQNVMPLLKRNEIALKEQGQDIFSVLKRFKAGERIELPDSTILDPMNRLLISDVKKGRHICILGDTKNARKMSDLVRNCDLLVHEATIGPVIEDILPKEGLARITSYNTNEMNEQSFQKVKKSIHAKGHSTAVDAAIFAREVGAKTLVLNHISNRYDYLDDEHYHHAVESIRELAMKYFQSPQVLIPNDLESIILEGIKR